VLAFALEGGAPAGENLHARQDACSALAKLALPDTTVTAAEIVAAGAFKPPTNASNVTPFANLPAFLPRSRNGQILHRLRHQN
jgi:hypothetical protein